MAMASAPTAASAAPPLMTRIWLLKRLPTACLTGRTRHAHHMRWATYTWRAAMKHVCLAVQVRLHGQMLSRMLRAHVAPPTRLRLCLL